MLTLTFLGVGSAFAKRNFHANALLEAWNSDPGAQTCPDDVLLIDFGATGPLALHQLMQASGFRYLERDGVIHYPTITKLFITHQHGDHVGGLEELAACNRHRFGLGQDAARPLPQILSTAEVLRDLWDKTLSGGLGMTAGGPARLSDYFRVVPLEASPGGDLPQFAVADRYDVGIVRVDHVRVEGRYAWPSFGLRIMDRDAGDHVFYSGDSRFDPECALPVMVDAKLVFHDTQLEDEPEPVHALLSQLRTLPPDIKRKTILYHYGDTWDDARFAFVDREFGGFAQPARRYVLFD